MIYCCQLHGRKTINSLQSILSLQEEEEGETLSPSERETFSKWHNVNSINTESISTGLKFWSTFEYKSQRNWNRTEFYLQEQPCPSCSSFWQSVEFQFKLCLFLLLTLGFDIRFQHIITHQVRNKPVSPLPLPRFAFNSTGLKMFMRCSRIKYL